MVNDHIISMPDKWEYPWYAAWDLAFHTIALSTVDVDFAKAQLDLMLQEFFLHPTGQIPAYEWNFSDVNPPVHAWATIFMYRTEQALKGEADLGFLRRSFAKLMLNFSWWVNRKDRLARIYLKAASWTGQHRVFDRSAPLATGGHLEQADGTAWSHIPSDHARIHGAIGAGQQPCALLRRRVGAASAAMPGSPRMLLARRCATHAVPSACSRWPPVGSGALRSNTPMLSSPRKPPSNRFLPKRSLRFTHQLKFSISLAKDLLRNPRSASPLSACSVRYMKMVAQACTAGSRR